MSNFESLPKSPDGKIDKERVKAAFLSSASGSWREVCEQNRWNPASRVQFPIDSWSREWLKAQIALQDESFAAAALECRGMLVKSRIEGVKSSLRISTGLSEIIEHMISLRRNKKSLGGGAYQEIESLVRTAKRVQELNHQNLWMLDILSEVKNEIGVDPISAFSNTCNHQNDSSSSTKLEFSLLGQPSGQTYTSEEITEMLSSWYDKQQEAEAEPQGVLEDESNQNAN